PDDRAPLSPPKGAARTRAKRALLRSSPTGATALRSGAALPARMGGPYLTRQGVGFHPVASVCFLKFVLVTNGVVRYCASSTIVVTTNHVEPSFSLERSKYSRSVVLSLYGTPFLRKYPVFRLVVTTSSDRPRVPSRGFSAIGVKSGGPAPRCGCSHCALEYPC